METIAGIKYTKNSKLKKHYVRIDLDIYGENELQLKTICRTGI